MNTKVDAGPPGPTQTKDLLEGGLNLGLNTNCSTNTEIVNKSQDKMIDRFVI